MAELFCRTSQLFFRTTIDTYRMTNAFCRKLCRITLQLLFLRIKVKVYLVSVFWIFLTSCNICERALSQNITHLHYSDLYGNIF